MAHPSYTEEGPWWCGKQLRAMATHGNVVCPVVHPWRKFVAVKLIECLPLALFLLPLLPFIFAFTAMWEVVMMIDPLEECSCSWPWMKLWKEMFTNAEIVIFTVVFSILWGLGFLGYHFVHGLMLPSLPASHPSVMIDYATPRDDTHLYQGAATIIALIVGVGVLTLVGDAVFGE